MNNTTVKYESKQMTWKRVLGIILISIWPVLIVLMAIVAAIHGEPNLLIGLGLCVLILIPNIIGGKLLKQ